MAKLLILFMTQIWTISAEKSAQYTGLISFEETGLGMYKHTLGQQHGG
jgi:hypothetical protein